MSVLLYPSIYTIFEDSAVRPPKINLLVIATQTHLNQNENTHHILADYSQSLDI